MVKNNQIIEQPDGKRFRVQLVEIVTPTYEMAREADYGMNAKDVASQHTYAKLKTLEHFYNGGEEGKFGIYVSSLGNFCSISFRQIFNFKNRETAQKFIEEQQELLSIFYQLYYGR
jgi:hypothetical protein